MKTSTILTAIISTSLTAFVAFLLTSCGGNTCYTCSQSGLEEVVCSRNYSEEDDFNAEIDSATYHGWTCVKE